MRVELSARDDALRYEIHVEPDDHEDGRSMLRRADPRVRLARREFRVVLPEGADSVHPDLHATALWLILQPFLGSRLRLPFAISAACAESLAGRFGVDVGPVDATLVPRRVPDAPPPALVFSGGADSTATSLVLPADTQHLFLDRIPVLPRGTDSTTLVALVQQRRLCERLRDDGRAVVVHRDDHETIYEPYPYPHTNMTILPALYHADRLGLYTLDMGAVMADRYFEGYALGAAAAWRFRKDEGEPAADAPEAPLPPAPASPEARTERAPTSEGCAPRASGALDDHLAVLGLRMAKSALGLSEVATARIVHRSAYRGATYSCFQKSYQSVCMECDKCFRKLLLGYVFDDREVPAALVEHFLTRPRLARFLDREYLDFHDVWFYLFQRIRTTHPVARALRAQAEAGPDVGMLAHWYPPAARHVPLRYRDEVVRNLTALAGAMSPDEVARLEALALPPLRTTKSAASAAPERPDAAP